MIAMLLLLPDFELPVFEFDATSVPPCQTNTLMDALLKGAKAFYSQPGAEEHYQTWLKNRNERGVDRRKEQA